MKSLLAIPFILFVASASAQQSLDGPAEQLLRDWQVIVTSGGHVAEELHTLVVDRTRLQAELDALKAKATPPSDHHN